MFDGLMSRCRVIERARDRPQELDRLLQLHRPAQAVRERAAFHQLEDEEGDTALLAEIEDIEDVGVVQASHRSCFLLEAIAVSVVFGEEIGQDFDRDISIEGVVVGPVHGRHPAAADLADDPVGTQRVAVGQAHWFSLARMTIASRGTYRTTRACARYESGAESPEAQSRAAVRRLESRAARMATSAGAETRRAAAKSTARIAAGRRPAATAVWVRRYPPISRRPHPWPTTI